MKILQIIAIPIGSLIITILSVYLPINGIKMLDAIYCGPPAGLPFAFALAKGKLFPDVGFCMAVLPTRTVLSALVLDLIVYLIIIIAVLKLFKLARR